MKKMGNNIIIGVDHGYGYIKSASTIFKSGVEELPIKPPFTEDILELKNRTFVVGQIRNDRSQKCDPCRRTSLLVLFRTKGSIQGIFVKKENIELFL